MNSVSSVEHNCLRSKKINLDARPPIVVEVRKMRAKTIPYWTRPENIVLNLLLRPLRLVPPPLVREPFSFELRTRPRNKYRRWLAYCLSADYKMTFTERIVEVPFVLQHMTLPVGSRILEFGCCQSLVSIQLASLGYKVTGVDVEGYDLSHPNFSFLRTDFMKNQFSDESFDGVVAISAIEHAGLGFYGDISLDDGDRAVVDEVRRILRKGGTFLLTLPYGVKARTPWYRVYDDCALRGLLSEFKIVDLRFFDGRGRSS
jgi:SAM-dependent methyltransferase